MSVARTSARPTSTSYTSQASASRVVKSCKGGGVFSASAYDNASLQLVLIMIYRKNHSLPTGTGFYRSLNSTLTLCTHFTCKGGEHY